MAHNLTEQQQKILDKADRTGFIPQEDMAICPGIHFCPDWNDMAVCIGCPEAEICTCDDLRIAIDTSGEAE